MPIISRITTQQKNKERYNIFLQENRKEKFGFSVDETVLIAYHLHKGQELDEKTIDELMDKDSMQKAYNMVIHYLSYRMRTEKEIVDYLEKNEIPEMHIAPIMEKLIQNKLVDDHEFANAFVRTRMNTSDKGPGIIRKEMLDKGISENETEEAIKQYSYEEQYHKAQKILKKKSNQSTRHSHRQKMERIQTHLLQKGFTMEVIKDVVASNGPKKDEGEEWEALVLEGEKQLRRLERKYEGLKLEHKVKEALYRKRFAFPLIQSFLEEYVKTEADEFMD